VQRTGYFAGRPPVRGTSFARSRFERPAQRAVPIFDANSDRAAFDFVPQRPFARAAAAFPFLRVGVFLFIGSLVLRIPKWAPRTITTWPRQSSLGILNCIVPASRKSDSLADHGGNSN
jgi:hypothetical protein